MSNKKKKKEFGHFIKKKVGPKRKIKNKKARSAANFLPNLDYNEKSKSAIISRSLTDSSHCSITASFIHPKKVTSKTKWASLRESYWE